MSKPFLSRDWSEEVTDFIRAFAGSAIFGIPLVFTMEMWWIGKSLPLSYLLLLLLIGFVTNLGLAHVAGFRNQHSFIMSLDQAIDALAVGMVTAAALLIALNQLRVTDGIGQSARTIIALAVPLSLGASVAREVFSGRVNRELGDEEDEDGEGKSLSVAQELLNDIGATAVGGVFIGLAIAVTDEIPMIAAGITLWHLVALIGVTLLISYIIVFASGFDTNSPPGPFQHPFTETILAYVISLVVAFAMLLVFERLTLDDPFQEMFKQTVVLALPATVGGAGGRLVI